MIRNSLPSKIFASLLFASTLVLEPSLAHAENETGVSLEFSLTKPTIAFNFADGTKSDYSGVCGVTQFQAPFFEQEHFKIGGTISYRYMEILNTGISATQFGVHTGFGAGVQMNYRFLLLGVNQTSMTAKDFLTGSSLTNSNFDYSLTSIYGGLVWQFGALGVGAYYSSGESKMPSSTFTKGSEAKMTEQLMGLRLNYNFGLGSKKFFTSLFK